MSTKVSVRSRTPVVGRVIKETCSVIWDVPRKQGYSRRELDKKSPHDPAKNNIKLKG